MHFGNQPLRFPIRAYEYVQTVVECDAVDFHAPRAATQNGAGFIHRYRHALRGQRNGCGHACVAATDDGDALRCFSHVINNLIKTNSYEAIACQPTLRAAR